MSTIRCDNFGPSAGGTTYSARGIAKVWVNFNGTGTIAARDSENVSSLTDNGTGIYAVNFSNAFGATDYSAVGGGGQHSGTPSNNNVGVFYRNMTTSNLGVQLAQGLTSSIDQTLVCVSMNGDLA